MPGYVIAAILLGFPLLELFLLILVSSVIGGWVFALLLASAAAGWLLIKEERTGFIARMEATRDSSTSLVSAIAASGRNVVAGILLIIPGLLTDIAAVALLLWPVKKVRRSRGGLEFGMTGEWPGNEQPPLSPSNPAAGNHDRSGSEILEGDFRRID